MIKWFDLPTLWHNGSWLLASLIGIFLMSHRQIDTTSLWMLPCVFVQLINICILQVVTLDGWSCLASFLGILHHSTDWLPAHGPLYSSLGFFINCYECFCPWLYWPLTCLFCMSGRHRLPSFSRQECSVVGERIHSFYCFIVLVSCFLFYCSFYLNPCSILFVPYHICHFFHSIGFYPLLGLCVSWDICLWFCFD